jgi:peptidoglycan/xylan/chitin deacetylase (PgdA/CDA1 family)
MRSVLAIGSVLATVMIAGPATGAGCPGNPDALGTSRTIVVDPSEHSLLGGFQYRESLPLNDREVVITFDDGPLPPYSTRILDILARECVKATYFMVGRMVRAFPKVVRRTFTEGHTIANHSQNHSYAIHRLPIGLAAKEIEDGFESLRVALGDPAAVAPFFRFPGLLREGKVERYLASRKVMSWSVDFMADDWTRISSSEVVRRALMRIEAKGKGILLLHDIQPATALGLPTLLRELKARGYRVVHVVPTGRGRIKTATAPEQWVVRHPPRQRDDGIWSRVVAVNGRSTEPVLAAPSVRSFGAVDEVGTAIPVALGARPAVLRSESGKISLPVNASWPRAVAGLSQSDSTLLPAPAMENFRYHRLWKNRAGRSKARRPAVSKARTKAAAKDANSTSKELTPSRKRVRSKLGPGKAKTKDAGRPNGPQRSGHQIQLPKPSASLWGSLTESLASLTR